MIRESAVPMGGEATDGAGGLVLGGCAPRYKDQRTLEGVHGRTSGPPSVLPVPREPPVPATLPCDEGLEVDATCSQSSGPDGRGFADLGPLQFWFSPIGTSQWIALPVVGPVPRASPGPFVPQVEFVPTSPSPSSGSPCTFYNLMLSLASALGCLTKLTLSLVP